ncbi:uncharacterized protein [Littorina saxatilis]|uniref:uncharacterized protein n=1 Tax=Littorina saxatilis TaxID=31220 RepID=UPI0038B5803A
MLGIINGIGNCLPPCLVFPRKNYKNHMLFGAPPAAETTGPAAAETIEPAATETTGPAAAETIEPAAAETREPIATETTEPAAEETTEPAAEETTESGSVKDGKTYTCIICTEPFCTSRPGEVWIQCGSCLMWCHEECAEIGTLAVFTCDFCK